MSIFDICRGLEALPEQIYKDDVPNEGAFVEVAQQIEAFLKKNEALILNARGASKKKLIDVLVKQKEAHEGMRQVIEACKLADVSTTVFFQACFFKILGGQATRTMQQEMAFKNVCRAKVVLFYATEEERLIAFKEEEIVHKYEELLQLQKLCKGQELQGRFRLLTQIVESRSAKLALESMNQKLQEDEAYAEWQSQFYTLTQPAIKKMGEFISQLQSQSCRCFVGSHCVIL